MAKVPPRNPKYTPADLWPPGSQYVDFPPAAFHPVYLGNFLCQNFWDLGPRVQEYFASKGLLARMVFNRNADRDPFRAYQDKTKLYDCLVYFTRAEDAQDAIKYLHRDRYYGHRLNIFPGRTPVFFDASKSVRYTIQKHSGSITEQVLENSLIRTCSSTVLCTVKHSKREAFVEFSDPANMERAIERGLSETLPSHVDPDRPRQRFLEQHVRSEMYFHMTANPRFMFLMPERHVLEALYQGNRPHITEDWSRDLVVGSGRQDKRAKRIARKAVGKVEKKAARRGLSMSRWRNHFPGAEDWYVRAAAGDSVAYVKKSRSDRDLYQYAKLYNLGLRYIAKKRTKVDR